MSVLAMWERGVFYFCICIMLMNTFSSGVLSAAMRIGNGSGDRPICLYHMSDKVNSPEDNLSGDDQLLGDGTVLCDAPTDYCFSYWQIQPSTGTNMSAIGDISPDDPAFSWLARGCFKNADSCHRNSCVATKREMENSFFCCCIGNRCNEKIDFEEATHVPASMFPDPVLEITPLDPVSKSLYILSGSLLFIMVSFASVMGYKMRKRSKGSSSTPLGLSKSPTSPCIDLNNLKFLEVLGQGRYGTVFKAILGDEDVAVKLFYPHQKVSFSNEKYIYSLPLMEHSNLLSYLGGGEIIGPDNNQYLGLVLSYCPGGNLSGYLRENTLDWQTFCKIVITAVKGLGHLQSDVRRGDLLKPCVSHRDFNTRNILLKDDMTCVVSDLGFAIHTQGAKFYQNGEEQIAEMASLTDVGTLRYMAPEVLEGAVNLRDCETSLKQIDIYALGLVLWEIAYRCHDLYQGTQTPNYALPFQAEIGLHPSFEQMQVLVARNKARPLFPQIWKDTSPAIKQLKETIEDCWDNDAEARLSAMCVERRLYELPKLWSRHKASLGMNGISPTTNPPSSGSSFPHSDDMTNFINNELCLYKEKDSQWNRDSSTSENTVETTLPCSPSDGSSRAGVGKNYLMEAVKVAPLPPLQPHQGRNPCLQRNTINEFNSSDSLSSNDFVEASSKYACPNLQGRNNLYDILDSQHATESEMRNEHLVPLIGSPLSENHGNSDHQHTGQTLPALPFHTPHVPPIPYLQNETRIWEGLPKLQNAEVESQRAAASRRNNWKKFLGDLLIPLFPHRRVRVSGAEEEQNILVTPSGCGASESLTPLSPFGVIHNSAQMPQESKIMMANGEHFTTVISSREECVNAVISPLSRPPLHMTDPVSTIHSPPPSLQLPQEHLNTTEIGVAKLQHPITLTAVVCSKQGSKDSGINKSSENSNSFIDSDSSLDKVRRPATLILLNRNRRRLSSSLMITSDEDQDSDGEKRAVNAATVVKLRKPKHRVKTPINPVSKKLPRLSLCNDSLSGESDTQLSQAYSRSLPYDIDSVDDLPSQREYTIPEQSSGSSLSDKPINYFQKHSESSDEISDNSSLSGSAKCGINNYVNTNRTKTMKNYQKEVYPAV